MFPIGDDQVQGAPPAVVNWTLIIFNSLMFIYELFLGDNVEQFIMAWGVTPANIQQGHDLITLLTSQFLHGGWLHVVGNMLFLYVFGDNIEALLGHVGYLIFYLFTGVAAGLAQVFFSPGSTVPSIGASGAIAGVLGAYVLLFPHSRVRTLVVAYYIGITRISAVFFLGVWFVMQFFSSFASLGVSTAQTGGVAYFAHVGGFISGLVLAVIFRVIARPNYSY